MWDWGTPLNTADLSIRVADPSHPLFRGLNITDNELTLFSQCNTNAVTAISGWTNTTGFTVLASPVSNNTATAVAYLPAGTDCNGIVLPQPMVMVGVSEYSTAHLTDDGKKLIENAILYLLGMDTPDGIDNQQSPITNNKFIQDGTLYIQAGDVVFDAFGRRVNR